MKKIIFTLTITLFFLVSCTDKKTATENLNEGIEDFPSNSNNFYIRPVLDVVGIKINSFKNSVSAIKMFLSARIKVNNI